MDGQTIITVLRNEMPVLVNNYGVEAIGLFGSYAKGTQNEQSDIDFLVKVKPPFSVNFFGLWNYLEKKFNKKIDLTRNGSHLRPKFMETINREIIYA